MVKYDNFQDDEDEEDGHGTMVSGIVAGKKSTDGILTNQEGFADGIAREAKIAFYDIGLGASECGWYSLSFRPYQYSFVHVRV